MPNIIRDTTLYDKEYFAPFIESIAPYVDSKEAIQDSVRQSLLNDFADSDILPVQINNFVNRWNTSLDAWSNGITSPNATYPDIISKDSLDYYDSVIQESHNYALSRGFENVGEMYQNLIETIQNDLNRDLSGVCTNVSIQLNQTATMTREAFRGTFTIENGHGTEPVTDFLLDIKIRDEAGNICNDLFQINVESLESISSIDGQGVVGADTRAKANMLFIPTNEAAINESKMYYFGGS